MAHTVMEHVRDVLVMLAQVLYYWLVAIVRAILPASIQGKDISGETVLITGAETASICKGYGVSVDTYTINLCDREAIYKLADKTVKAFLPDMMTRNHGHIVNIASSAGLIGVTGLADYCASKFAAVGFDESLRFELMAQGKTGINTTVVCPFFINTGMFEGAKTRFPFLLPILEPAYVADKIVEAVLCNQTLLALPRILYVFFAIKGFIPSTSGYLLSKYLGAHNLMDEFKGRQKAE
ncbi:RDHE2-like protein [Mya arenaria]|uniref:RDHE2-like protein n=1 Tax=Mya arenaria TaxID=6604 RepID=A0ABY7FAU7_MYAAR|nr:RDHE2-like protein [Mya arenaria]